MNDATGTTERRASDEDAALEHAFVAGTLPDEDRRALAKGVSAAPLAPAFSINAAQHQRSEEIAKQIGLTIPHVELPHWHELLTIWGHR